MYQAGQHNHSHHKVPTYFPTGCIDRASHPAQAGTSCEPPLLHPSTPPKTPPATASRSPSVHLPKSINNTSHQDSPIDFLFHFHRPHPRINSYLQLPASASQCVPPPDPNPHFMSLESLRQDAILQKTSQISYVSPNHARFIFSGSRFSFLPSMRHQKCPLKNFLLCAGADNRSSIQAFTVDPYWSPEVAILRHPISDPLTIRRPPAKVTSASLLPHHHPVPRRAVLSR
jgi:hypothetical protein